MIVDILNDLFQKFTFAAVTVDPMRSSKDLNVGVSFSWPNFAPIPPNSDVVFSPTALTAPAVFWYLKKNSSLKNHTYEIISITVKIKKIKSTNILIRIILFLFYFYFSKLQIRHYMQKSVLQFFIYFISNVNHKT